MENILSFDEYNDFSLSEGLFTIDFIHLLMEEEHRLGLDCIDVDEGFSLSQKIPGKRESDRTARFVPGKNDNEMTTTKIFTDEKKFNYYPQKLEKSGIDSINLYKFGDITISKLLKHPEEYKEGQFSKDGQRQNIDEESIDKFFRRSALYIRSIIKELDFDIDIITYPNSSSKFNEILTDYVMAGYKNKDDKNFSSIKVIPKLLNKSINTVIVNRDRAKELGMTDEEINKLEHQIESWKKQYKDVYPIRLQLDQMIDTLISYRAGFVGKKGRRPKDYFTLMKNIEDTKQRIKDAKKAIGMSKGKEKFVKYVDPKDIGGIDVEGKGKKIARARDFEIKSLDDKTRKAIENLFTLNDDLSKYKTSTGEEIYGVPIEDKIKGKNIVIFDDNISSGATLDDMCLTLLKNGAKKVLPITMAIIPPTVYGNHDTKAFRDRKGVNESHTLQIDLDKETVTDVELFDNGDANYYFTTDEPLPDNTATMKAFLDMVDNTDESIEWDYDGSQAFGKMRNGKTIQIDAGGDGDFTHHLVSVTIVK